jgi:hypothetical protein
MNQTKTHEVLHRSVAMLHCQAVGLDEVLQEALACLAENGNLPDAQRERLLVRLEEDQRPPVDDLGHGCGVMRLSHHGKGDPQAILIRLAAPFVARDGARVRFLWLVVGPNGAKDPVDEELEPFGWMLQDPERLADAIGADTRGDLLAVYSAYLEELETPALEHEVPVELRRTGRPLGGLIDDIKRRMPHYLTDFSDGLHPKALASVFFLFFACFAPAVAFGGLLGVLTDGQVGAMEMIVATALCGTVYALFSGQPLTILGSTGPIIIFMGILYRLTQDVGIPFLPSLAWVGLWTSLILIVMAVTEASSLIQYFTRFTDETFAALISLIFIVEAIKDMLKGFDEPGSNGYEAAFFGVILALGTYIVATALRSIRRSAFLRRPIREFLADFGPTIAIGSMAALSFVFHPVDVETLTVPASIQPSYLETLSNGVTQPRAWFVNPLDAPMWVWAASILPAILVSLLIYLDQNITVRLVNNPDYKLKKGAGYHLDMAVVGVLIAICSLFGLPWMVAATVRSLNHVNSLATVESHGGKERVVAVRETRLTGLLVHVMVGLSLLFLGVLSYVPMSVLFGLFLFMGVASMSGNQFFERVRLWVTDPQMLPPTHYVRRVPKSKVSLFTVIQAVCLGVLWVVKTSTLGILFPVFIALLVPIRALMKRFFSPEQLAYLDAEEDPEMEREADAGP